MIQSCVRDLGFAEAQVPDFGEVFQVFQVSVCDLGALEFDPASGVYRPAKQD